MSTQTPQKEKSSNLMLVLLTPGEHCSFVTAFPISVSQSEVDHRIVGGWKGPLEVIESNPLLKQVPCS